jgi:signal transduction histidine kinase
VFELFETDSMGSHHRGTGLGLSLVRSFVQLHGGSITIDSTLGNGTLVTCVFPTGRAAAQTAA